MRLAPAVPSRAHAVPKGKKTSPFPSSPRLPALLLTVLVALTLSPLPALAKPKSGQGDTVHDAAIVAKQARAYYDQRQYPVAAELYSRAFVLNPARPEYLYGVGRAQQMAGQFAAAREALGRLGGLLPPNHPLQGKATASLAEMDAIDAVAAAERSRVETERAKADLERRTREAAEAKARAEAAEAEAARRAAALALAQAATPTAPVTAVVQPEPRETWPQTVALSVGGALGAVAVGMGIWAQVETTDLADDKGSLRGVDAAERQRGINNLSTASLVTGVAGAAAASVGLYLALRPDTSAPRVVVGTSGLGLTWRF